MSSNYIRTYDSSGQAHEPDNTANSRDSVLAFTDRNQTDETTAKKMLPDRANPYDAEANPSQPFESNGAKNAESISESAVDSSQMDSSQTDETTAKNLDRARSGFGASCLCF